MKKGIVVILAVAIIGVLGIYGKSHPSTGTNAAASSSDVMAMANSSDNSGGAAVSPDNTNSSSSSGLKDGTFTGNSENTPYGTVQIAVVVSGGKISGVNFLQMPNDLGHTQQVTAMSEPLLKAETLQNQSSHIDFVSGATSTSEGYIQSLQSALDQAAMS